MGHPTIEALACILGKKTAEVEQVLYFGAEIVTGRELGILFAPGDVVDARQAAYYREKYGSDYQGSSGYDGLRTAVENIDFSHVQQSGRLAELLHLHPRILGQMLRPDFFVATAPQALSGSLFCEAVYDRVCHQVEAVPAQEVLRRYLLHKIQELQAEDDAACRMENHCDRVVLSDLGWVPEEEKPQAQEPEKNSRQTEDRNLTWWPYDAEDERIWEEWI